MTRLATCAGALSVAAVVGCGELQEGENPEATETQAAPIINGTPVTTDTWGSPFDGCSGTMLRDRWFLTVKHCMPGVGGSLNLVNGTTAHFQAPIFAHPDPNQDIAIGRVDAPLTPSGSASTSGPYPLYRGSEAQLLNKTIYCQGWGINQNPCPDAGNCGYGTLRSANLTVDHIGPANPDFCTGECFLTPHGTQQTGGGDSGGGCRSTPGNTQIAKVVGVIAGSSQTEDYHESVPWFRDWANGIIGSAPTFGQVAGFERNDLINSAFYVSPTNNHLIELSSSGFTSWFRGDLGSLTGAANAASGSNPTAFVRFDGYASVAYRDSNNQITELSLQHGGSSWGKRVLSPAGAPTATGNPSSYGRTDRVGIVLYRSGSSPTNHIIELSFNPGQGAVWNDMTSIFGLPNTASDPVGYIRADGLNAVVYRSSGDDHVRELAAQFGQNWSAGDITANAAAPAAQGQPRPFTRQDGVSAVVYRSGDNHIQQLALSATGGNWTVTDLTAATNSPVALSDPFGYVRVDGIAAVVYKTSGDFHIHELTWSGSSWSHADLTSLSGAPAASGTGMSAFVSADRRSTIMYRTSDNHVHQLTRNVGSSTWGHGDLTLSAGGSV